MTFFNIVSSEKLTMGQVFKKFVIKVYLFIWDHKEKNRWKMTNSTSVSPNEKNCCKGRGEKIQIFQHLWDSASKLNCK